MKKLFVWENVLVGLFLLGLSYAIFFSIAPVGLSAVSVAIYACLYAMTGDMNKMDLGKAIYLWTIPATVGFSIYFFWATTWIWPMKILVGFVVGQLANITFMRFAAWNAHLDPKETDDVPSL